VSGNIGISGPGFEISSFTESVGSPPRTQYMVTVVWRGGGMQITHASGPRGGIRSLPFSLIQYRPFRSLWGHWMFLRHVAPDLLRHIVQVFAARLLPRRLRHLFWRADRHDLSSDWSASSHGDGKDKREVKYSRNRRVVAVRDREFSVPGDGRMLVLLVDDAPGVPGGLSVVERLIELPGIERAEIDRTLPKEALIEAMRARHRKECAVWQSAMDADPVVARFIADCKPRTAQ
jgi:hypothetical protein